MAHRLRIADTNPTTLVYLFFELLGSGPMAAFLTIHSKE